MNTGNWGDKHCGSVSRFNSCWLNLNSVADGHVSLRGEYKGIQRAFLLAYPRHLVTVLFFEKDCGQFSRAVSYSGSFTQFNLTSSLNSVRTSELIKHENRLPFLTPHKVRHCKTCLPVSFFLCAVPFAFRFLLGSVRPKMTNIVCCVRDPFKGQRSSTEIHRATFSS